MRSQFVAIVVVLVGAGCVSSQPATEKTKKPPPGSDRIEISNSAFSGIPSPGRTAKWVLVKGGGCRGSVEFGQLTERYELPSEVFEECRKILDDTNFFQMKDPEPTGFQFEPGCVSITAKAGGPAHSVACVGNAKQSPGFVRLYTFLEELPKRGKVVESAP
jgi:hypothetical protein